MKDGAPWVAKVFSPDPQRSRLTAPGTPGGLVGTGHEVGLYSLLHGCLNLSLFNLAEENGALLQKLEVILLQL